MTPQRLRGPFHWRGVAAAIAPLLPSAAFLALTQPWPRAAAGSVVIVVGGTMARRIRAGRPLGSLTWVTLAMAPIIVFLAVSLLER